MAKTLNKWLDEFVENGADASNITDWPENAGGGGGSDAKGVNFVPVRGMSYKLGVDELVRVATLMEQDYDAINEIEYAYYMYGRGGSGVEFEYGVTITNDDSFVITLPDENQTTIILTSSGTMSRTLAENKATIENTIFTLSAAVLDTPIYIGIAASSYNNYLYPIDLTKLFIPVEE